MEDEARSRADALRDFGRRAAEIAEQRVPGGPAVFESLEREQAAGSGLLAGGVAYRLFLWLVPFGLVLAAIASFWSEADPGGVEEAAKELGMAGITTHTAQTAFETGDHSRWYLLGVGIVLLLWFGASAVRALRVAHAIAWGIRAERLRNPLYASLAFAGFIVGLALIGFAVRWARENWGRGPGLAGTLALFAVYCAAALAAMALLPHADVPWAALLPGMAVVAIGMQLMHVVVVVYLVPQLGRSSELYGSLGISTVVLLWLYLAARLIVSAAFLNATLWDRSHRA
jgi:membrane protein